MSEQVVNQTNSVKMLRAMVGIGVMCALMIVLTFQGTLPRIEANRAAALEAAIFKVLPGINSKQVFRLDDDQFILAEDGNQYGDLIYAGYDQKNELVGFAIPARGMGYADVISMLYGYNPAKEAVVGFYVLESKETPGLGDKIEKDENFLANFDALDVSLDQAAKIKQPIMTVKSGAKQNAWEIDGITGATISSRAIGETLAESTARWIPLINQRISDFKSKELNE